MRTADVSVEIVESIFHIRFLRCSYRTLSLPFPSTKTCADSSVWWASSALEPCPTRDAHALLFCGTCPYRTRREGFWGSSCTPPACGVQICANCCSKGPQCRHFSDISKICSLPEHELVMFHLVHNSYKSLIMFARVSSFCSTPRVNLKHVVMAVSAYPNDVCSNNKKEKIKKWEE